MLAVFALPPTATASRQGKDKRMPDDLDWKQKYRDALLQAEAEEKRWKDAERVLRRLVGRLCAAGMGADPQLDEELGALAAANRRNADTTELERLAARLKTAVVAADITASLRQLVIPAAAAPASAQDTVPGRRWDSTCAALTALIERLKWGEADHSRLQGLIGELAAAATDGDLAAIVARTADLIRERSETLARERSQAAAVLAEVTQRLDEMAGFLTESNSANRNHFDDTRLLNDSVMLQVHELTAEVSGATELRVLQSLVGARLASVAQQFSAFRAREAARMAEYDGRAAHMRGRIADLERETRELHSRLDQEKHGARLDPMTGVANRKSFDERLAQEIIRRARGGAPSVLLLWDIDNFKVINDSYGHKAGDRVLHSVATCFRASLRASDFIARIGGEEFGVLLSGIRIAEAEIIANKVRLAVEGLRFHFRETPVRITVSCGITELVPDDTPEPAFERADAALYRAKNGGRNRCEVG
jgi:diguanylate cyclase